MKKISYILLCSIISIISSKPTLAQSIDYSEFEAMFGEPVTKSANGSPQRLKEVPLNMEIITAEEIDRMGARTIPEILRFVPGLSVRQITMGQTEVGIRGYNQAYSERILVLVNGKQVYLDSYGQVIWGNIPVEIAEIRQIEIVKGPNTALFGFNAVSGVINIVTANPLYNEINEIKNTVSIGSESMFETSGIYTAKKDNAAVRIAAGWSEADDDFKDVQARTTDTRRQSGTVATHYKITDKIETQVELSENKYGYNEYMIARFNADNEYKTDSARGRILADTSYGLIDADAYFTQTNLKFYEGAIKTDNKVLVTKLNDTLEYGKDHIFRFGGEYREGSNIYEPREASELKYKILTANGLWDWRATDNLRTSLALRFDHFQLRPNGNNVNPLYAGYPIAELGLTANDFYQTRDEYSINLGSSYQLSDIETIKASYARGVDLPSFTEFGLQVNGPVPTIRYVGTPDTETSIVNNYEFDYDRKIEEIDGKFRGAVFYQTSEKMQGFGKDLVLDAGTQFSIIGNLGDSKMHGFELGLEGKLNDAWNWSANYAFIKINDDLANEGVTNYQSCTEYEKSNTEHTVNATVGYTAPNWRADVGAQYLSGGKDLKMNPVNPANFIMHNVNDTVVVNANYSYDVVEGLTWSIAGQNLAGSTSQSVYSQAERTVWTSIKIKF